MHGRLHHPQLLTRIIDPTSGQLQMFSDFVQEQLSTSAMEQRMT
jgi:hypothetical protein